MNGVSGSRAAPPYVPEVVIDGVRYDQLMNGNEQGLGQVGGCLAAYDDTSGELLWAIKVYDNARDPDVEGDIQDVFFKSMTVDGGKLRIENEVGQVFLVDPASRDVEEITGRG